ncbi:MAG: uncharacterized protein PWP10_4028 [Clostridiales bacterium]|jgi:fermentation-respiration switch protein FrsA (DUF1100 family)|nr:uncharacterized protein [Clostridiales bacterium]
MNLLVMMDYSIIIPVAVVVILIIICLTTFVLACVLASQVIKPPRRTHEFALNYHITNNGVAPEYYSSLKREEWQIRSLTGNLLKGEWISPDDNNTRRVLIMVHGHGHNLMGNLKYLPIFLRRGFKILIYDQIHSGISEGKFTTMGFHEAPDVSMIIDSICKQNKLEIIGLLGESMGAATVIMTAARDRRVDFVIADCAYADLDQQLSYRLKYAYNLRRFPLIPLGSLIAKLRCGFYWHQVSPIKELEIADGLPDTPILFAHGLSDTYIPPQASQDLYNVKSGYRDLLLVAGARHTESVCTAPADYEQAVDRLINAVITG